MKKIIVLFKTHLDLGFTDFASEVAKNYLQVYLPRAMGLAREMRGQKERFIWTTGSWLLAQYLETGKDKEMLYDAIRQGEIRWHGLPFTTHTELMDRELFTYGLSISQKLDRQFHRKTIAAKMTDVPGHTKAMIAPLVKAGIRFLHIGVNPASTRPDVPGLFRWGNGKGEEIVVMYHGTYGDMCPIGASQTAVYFAHTGDNCGPQSAAQVQEVYGMLHELYPKAQILPGTLEDVAQIAIRQPMPLLEEEIGDTWIHGAATDPKKMSQFRGLLRLKDQLPEEAMERMYRKLLLIPEHTWGLDEKACLGGKLENGDPVGEHHFFRKEEFAQARGQEPFQRMERSWQEQRDYLTKALEELPKDVGRETRAAVEQVMGEYKRARTDTAGWQEKKPLESFFMGERKIRVTETGKIEILSEPQAPDLSVRFCYEVFSEKDYERFQSQYLVSRAAWALEDFGKIGLGQVVEAHHWYETCAHEIRVRGKELVVSVRLPEEAVRLYGGMELIEIGVRFEEERIAFDAAWFGKQASRIPEAVWIQIETRDRIVSLQKMGQEISPTQVVSGGNRCMHAVEAVGLERRMFQTLDAPLVSIARPGLLDFTDETPKLDRGFYLNLYNNVWGTNFPMWYQEDARFRFSIAENPGEEPEERKKSTRGKEPVK